MYYIIEHQLRPDGIVNTSETGRSSLASAKSYYYERLSKMVMSEQFCSVAIMLVDAELHVIDKQVVATQYVPPVAQTEQEA